MQFITGLLRSYYWYTFLFFVIFLSLILSLTPISFPENSIITIEEGASVRSVASELKGKRALFSENIFVILFRISGNSVQAGSYLLDSREGSLSLAMRLAKGDYRLAPVKVTFPEGLTVKEMASICAKTLIGCNEQEFILSAKGLEGYLFPETYIFLLGTPASHIIKTMRAEFDKRTSTLRPQAATFGQSFEDVVTMASLLEGEATSTEHRREVAGILWKRLSIGMPLQVDAAFAYVNGKTTFDLTREDLSIDSPYNTYRNKGLPPTPINNPGIDALTSAMTPIKSPYLYYLTGKDGRFYFARTYEEHLRNKARYLLSH